MIRSLLPALALLAASGCATLDVRSEGPAEGERAPEFMLRDDGGAPVQLAQMLERGKPALLVFVQDPSCSPCRSSLEEVRDLQPELDARGVPVLGISATDAAEVSSIETLLDLPYPLIADPDLLVAEAFGVLDADADRAVPAAIVVLPDRTIHWKHVGKRPWDVPRAGKVLDAVDDAIEHATKTDG